MLKDGNMAIEFLSTDFKPYFDFDFDSEQYRNSPYTLDQGFNEFSYFGKDHLNSQDNAQQVTYQDLLDWARSLNKSQKYPEDLEDELSDYEDDYEEDDIEDSRDDHTNKNENTTLSNSSQFTIGDFNVSSALSRLHYLTNYILKSSDPKTWVKKGKSEVGHYCGRAVRMAMEAGGLSTKGRPQYGGDYGDFLLKNGWQPIDGSKVPFQPGDICVSHGIGRKNKQGHYMGHISMYDGSKWVSDYVQSSWKQFKNAELGKNTFFYRYRG